MKMYCTYYMRRLELLVVSRAAEWINHLRRSDLIPVTPIKLCCKAAYEHQTYLITTMRLTYQ